MSADSIRLRTGRKDRLALTASEKETAAAPSTKERWEDSARN